MGAVFPLRSERKPGCTVSSLRPALVAQGIEHGSPKAGVAGSNPAGAHHVMSQDIGTARTYDCGFGSFFAWLGPGGAGGLVVAGGVEGELAEEFAGGGVDDADVEVVDEQDDAGSGVGSSDADVVEAAVEAQGDVAGCGRRGRGGRGSGCRCAVAGGGFGAGGVGGGGGGRWGSERWGRWCCSRRRRCRAGSAARRWWWRRGCWSSHLLQGLVEAFDAPMFVKPQPVECSC